MKIYWVEYHGKRRIAIAGDLYTSLMDKSGVTSCVVLNHHMIGNPDIKVLPDCTGWDWKPERKYIPYDVQTMPILQVRIKSDVEGIVRQQFTAVPCKQCVILVNTFGDLTTVYGLTRYYSYQDFLNLFETIYSEPCGVKC